MIMEAEVDYKKMKFSGYEETNCKVKDWMSPHVVTDFTDHKKQKHLMVEVVLPTGLVVNWQFSLSNKMN